MCSRNFSFFSHDLRTTDLRMCRVTWAQWLRTQYNHECTRMTLCNRYTGSFGVPPLRTLRSFLVLRRSSFVKIFRSNGECVSFNNFHHGISLIGTIVSVFGLREVIIDARATWQTAIRH